MDRETILSTPEIQNRLQAPDTHAAMFIGLGFLIFAVLTPGPGELSPMFESRLKIHSSSVEKKYNI
jgi:hypothetical protein